MKRLSLALMALIFFAACSGPAEETNAVTEPASEEQTETAEPVVEGVEVSSPKAVTLSLTTTGETMNEMAFEPKRLVVAAGSEVTLVLENKAVGEAMIHNAVIIVAGKQAEVIEAGMAAGPDNGYVGESEFVIAATTMANPGETVKVQFTAPTDPGTYQYICTYPGHTAMKGILMVK